jgi:hypothetical protein
MFDTQNQDPQCTACGSPLLRAVPMELLSKSGAVMVMAIAGAPAVIVTGDER